MINSRLEYASVRTRLPTRDDPDDPLKDRSGLTLMVMIVMTNELDSGGLEHVTFLGF